MFNTFKLFILFSIAVNSIVFAANNSTDDKILVIKNENNLTISDEEIFDKESVNSRSQRQTSACASSPCGKFGTCYDVPFPGNLPSGYYCVCIEGFNGNQCEKEINECDSNPCKNGADCFDLINAFLCNCPNGFTGINCESPINVNSPCQPGTCGDGECQLTTHPTYPYVCKCKDNTYKFEPCTSTTSCSASSCFNGGTCVPYSINEKWCNPSQVGKTCCQCLPGFTGAQCNIDIDECASNPCKNGATCNNLVNSYSCICPVGFIGFNCDIFVGLPPVTTTTTTTNNNNIPVLCPNQNACLNQGVCYIIGNSIRCICPEGFTGSICETYVGPVVTTSTTTVAQIFGCNPNPCANGGTCVSMTSGAFMGCFCRTGYIGTYCQTLQSIQTTTTLPPFFTTATTTTLPPFFTTATTSVSGLVRSCNPNPCWNGATCVSDNFGGFYGCFCTPGYIGTYCDIRSTATTAASTIAPGCNPNPCLNGGVCTTRGCICASGYSGQYCELLTTANLCQNIGCQNGGRCNVVSPKIAECWCTTGYSGYYCELRNAASRCSEVQCMNGGTCEERAPGITTYAYCLCKPGYTGTRCETEYFRCTSNGIFNDVYGCTNGRYLECAYYGQTQLGFPNGILYRRDCPPGLRYNPSVGYCDYAVNVKC